MSTSDKLLFGIYPGGITGDDTGGLAAGAPDDPDRISAALDLLQGGPDRPFLVRAYVPFTDTTANGAPHPTATPADAARYARRGRRLDLVAQYRSAAGDVPGYCDFLRDLVEQYGAVTDTLQVPEEPNATGVPTLTGTARPSSTRSSPGCPRPRSRRGGSATTTCGSGSTPRSSSVRTRVSSPT